MKDFIKKKINFMKNNLVKYKKYYYNLFFVICLLGFISYKISVKDTKLAQKNNICCQLDGMIKDLKDNYESKSYLKIMNVLKKQKALKGTYYPLIIKALLKNNEIEIANKLMVQSLNDMHKHVQDFVKDFSIISFLMYQNLYEEALDKSNLLKENLININQTNSSIYLYNLLRISKLQEILHIDSKDTLKLIIKLVDEKKDNSIFKNYNDKITLHEFIEYKIACD